METFETEGLADLIGRLEAVAAETGNCGRKVRRTLEQLLPLKGHTIGVIQLPLQPMSNPSMLAQLCLVDRLDTATAMANDAIRQVEEDHCLKIVFASFDEALGSLAATFELRLLRPLPSSVKALQAVLAHLAYGLRRILAMAAMTEIIPDANAIDVLLGTEALTEEKRVLYTEQAERLMRGDRSQARTTPVILTSLTSRLSALRGISHQLAVGRLFSPAA